MLVHRRCPEQRRELERRALSLRALRAANTSSTFDRRKRGDSASPLSRAPKGKSGTRDGAERRKEGAGAAKGGVVSDTRRSDREGLEH